MLPDTQHVAPVQPWPPHCAYFAAQLEPPPDEALVVVADEVALEVVVSVVGAAVVDGMTAVPLGPEVAAQVDSQPAQAAPALLVDPCYILVICYEAQIDANSKIAMIDR